jgi:hypothetical protein
MQDTIRDTIRLFDRCGIPNKIVNGGVLGRLGAFDFTFRNYYTVVDGKVPLAVAIELYSDLFKGDIRSGGDCGCRKPSTWATAWNGDRIVINPKETANVKDGIEKGSDIYKSLVANPKYQLCDNEEEYATYPKYVDTYHIDTELGVYIFVRTLKQHKLI